jgi:hypothetical protein
MTDGTYVIAVRGVAGPWVRAASCDVAVSPAGDTTVLRRAGTGQAALHGLLRRIQDLGLTSRRSPGAGGTGVRHLVPARCATGHRSAAVTRHPGK